MKKLYSDMLYVILILSVILFMIFIVRFMINESGKCLSNPFSYISNKVGYEDINCYCSKVGNGTIKGFMYNSTGVFKLK